MSVATQNMGSTSPSFPARWGLWIGLAALILVIALPRPAGLSVAGQYMLGIFAFAVITWMTHGVEYAASAVMIVALMAFLLGIAPDPARPGHVLGTGTALAQAMNGFTNSGVALVAAAQFIAVAMEITGLDKRIALKVLSLTGTSTHRILIGVISVSFVLSFFLPTASARVACVAPVVLGIISTFGIERRSRLAGMLMIALTQASGIWMIGVKTGSAQNVISSGLMGNMLHTTIPWINWLIAAAPWSIAMSVVLYFVALKMMPPETDHLEKAGASIKETATRLGSMTANEIKLLAIFIVLLGFWVTEGKLHPFDTSTTAVAAVALMFLPKVGLLYWKDVQTRIPWGTLVQLGVGVSLGMGLLHTGAAGWITNLVVNLFGIQHLSSFEILAILWPFIILIHLGFSSGSATAVTLVPILIGVLLQAKTPGINLPGMTMLLAFATSFGWILPVNDSQNMIALGTETFGTRDFMRVGAVQSFIGYLMLLLFAATYWKWLGYVV